MTWFKVGDTFPYDPRVVAAGNAAAGLWSRAGAWSAWQLTDGFVPDPVLKTMGKPSEIRALLDAGLWHKEAGGVRFDDWFADQPSAAEVLAQQAKRAEAGRRGGRASGITRRSKSEASASQSVRTETNPDPTRPVVETPPESPPPPPADAGEEERQLSLVPPPPPKPPTSRKQRIPGDWQPSATALRWAAEHHPGWERWETVEQFRDYWLGRGDPRLSWDATWRNRVTELSKRSGGGGRGPWRNASGRTQWEPRERGTYTDIGDGTF